MRSGPLTMPDTSLDGTDGPRALRPAPGRRLVALFYQEDGTPSCTSELSTFKQDFSILDDLRADVVGVSIDDLDSHRAFLDRLGGLPFPLLSDTGGTLARELGIWDEDNRRAKRAVFVVDEHGIILHASAPYNPSNLTEYENIFHALGLNSL